MKQLYNSKHNKWFNKIAAKLKKINQTLNADISLRTGFSDIFSTGLSKKSSNNSMKNYNKPQRQRTKRCSHITCCSN